jgi:hypothetical protein
VPMEYYHQAVANLAELGFEAGESVEAVCAS